MGVVGSAKTGRRMREVRRKKGGRPPIMQIISAGKKGE